MENTPERPGKFVKLKLTGEVVEVVRWDNTDVTIKYREENITLDQKDVFPLSGEDGATTNPSQ